MKAAIAAGMTLMACVSNAQVESGAWAKLGAGLFTNDEKAVYGSFEVGSSLGRDFRVQLGGTASPFHRFDLGTSSVRYGGRDLELLGTYKVSKILPLELSLGIDQPWTPARTDTALSYRALATLPTGKQAKWWLTAYGIAGADSIAMVGTGASLAVGHGLELMASGALPVQGNNSVSPSSGNRDRLGVYSVGLGVPSSFCRYQSLVEIAITNQVGWTTGMAATPTIGGFPGVRVSFEVRF